MSTCKFIRSPRRRMCVGDLEHDIQILNRKIQPPNANDSGAFGMSFDLDDVPIIAASITTPRGIKIFDKTNTEQDVTHQFGIYYDDKGDAEIDGFIYFDNRYFRILDINNLDERKEWALINCVERGSETKPVNYA